MSASFSLTPSACDVAASAVASVSALAPVASQAVRSARFVAALHPLAGAPLWHRVTLAGARKRGVAGITLGRVVYLAEPRLLDNWPLVVHELAHVAQMTARPVPAFLSSYAWDYLGQRAYGVGDHEAYLGIAAEREARRIEDVARKGPRPASPWFRTASVGEEASQ